MSSFLTYVQKAKFDNHFSRLPDIFYTKMMAELKAPKPYLVHFNSQLAEDMGLDPNLAQDPDALKPLYGQNLEDPFCSLASVYSGHQFGVWAGQLGDGRALLIGQLRNDSNQIFDLQLKGAGLTPYSRRGDGRAVFRSSLREYCAGEYMHQLGIPTSRALSLFTTGEKVFREEAEPGAVIARVAESHIRFGHFEHFFFHEQEKFIPILLDYVIEHFFPDLKNSPTRSEDFFALVVKRTAELIAHWQSVGFCHGVMNTDNMSILGLTLDYGPYGFMDHFNPHHICNHSDDYGRYSFAQQPVIGLWNLQVLAYALQPVLDFDTAKKILESYSTLFSNCYDRLMKRRCGLSDTASSTELWKDLLLLMQQQKIDYSLCFYYLQKDRDQFSNLFVSRSVDSWLKRYDEYYASYESNAINPHFVLRNWVLEHAIRDFEDEGSSAPLYSIWDLIKNPFTVAKDKEYFLKPPTLEQQKICVSCSS
jgi:serine/tyrosine/threonine adenylyltransferase